MRKDDSRLGRVEKGVNMSNWFKLCCFTEGDESWMISELKNGRLRFGWSPPGSDIRELDKLSWEELDKIELGNNEWKATGSQIYKKGQFLLYRILKDDFIVVQLTAPIREFYVFQVADGYDYSTAERDDFNHILNGKLLTDKPIPFYSKHISNELRHSLSMRGRYYQIYSEYSTNELLDILKNEIWQRNDLSEESSQSVEMAKMNNAIIGSTIEMIQNKWKSKDFEYFVSDLLTKLEGVEVKSNIDSGKGWDLTISLRDPLTGDLLLDNIPVQCKNYYGEVWTSKPIEDLERCIKNSPNNVNIAYLIILGNLTEEFTNNLNALSFNLTKTLERNIEFRVVDQRQLAKLYLMADLTIIDQAIPRNLTNKSQVI